MNQADGSHWPVTDAEAQAAASAAGLSLAPERAPGVADRLNTVRMVARELRDNSSLHRSRTTIGAASRDGLEPKRAAVAPEAAKGRPVRDGALEPRAGSMPTALIDFGLASLGRMLRDGDVSPIEVTQAYLDRAERLNPTLNAYITLVPERAFADAAQAETELRAGRSRGPMHGIPIAHKDLLATRGTRTTWHTEYFKDFVPTESAEIVKRLAAAGAVMLGKANTFELGAGDGDVFGLAVNPWALDRQTGGSSSGSAVAVSARMAAAATGTDAGGSIRVPAAFCGVVGLKPTAGLVDDGSIASGISVAGPMTRSVADAAVMLSAMRVPTPGISAQAEADELLVRLDGEIKHMCIGVPRAWLDVAMESAVNASLNTAMRVLEDAGAEIRDVAIPHAAYSEVMGAVITHVECFGVYRHLLERRAKLGAFVEELLIASQLYTAADFQLAMELRSVLAVEMEAAFAQCEVILTPVVPFQPALLEEKSLRVGDGSAQVNPRTGMGRFTRLSNITGGPSLSVPTGLSPTGLPTAVQLIGRPFKEEVLLRVARVLEASTPVREQMPPFA